MSLANDMSPEELKDLLKEYGSVAKVAEHLGVSATTLRYVYRRYGIANGRVSQPLGFLTREALDAALQPPNNCHVKRFLDQLDEEQRVIAEEALGYDAKDLPGNTLRQLLIDSGYDERVVPGVDAIADHRKGRRPCRCKG